MSAQLDEAKQFLKSAPADGSASLYDHLSQVLLKIVLERPADANQQFEEISSAVRTTSLKTPQPLPEEATVRLNKIYLIKCYACLLYTSPSPRD